MNGFSSCNQVKLYWRIIDEQQHTELDFYLREDCSSYKKIFSINSILSYSIVIT